MFTDSSDFLLPNANFAVMCMLLQTRLLLKSYANKFLYERDSDIAGKQQIMFIEGSGKLISLQYVRLREKYINLAFVKILRRFWFFTVNELYRNVL
jgi:predicted GNAT superfamily acetyltransferase